MNILTYDVNKGPSTNEKKIDFTEEEIRGIISNNKEFDIDKLSLNICLNCYAIYETSIFLIDYLILNKENMKLANKIVDLLENKNVIAEFSNYYNNTSVFLDTFLNIFNDRELHEFLSKFVVEIIRYMNASRLHASEVTTIQLLELINQLPHFEDLIFELVSIASFTPTVGGYIQYMIDHNLSLLEQTHQLNHVFLAGVWYELGYRKKSQFNVEFQFNFTLTDDIINTIISIPLDVIKHQDPSLLEFIIVLNLTRINDSIPLLIHKDLVLEMVLDTEHPSHISSIELFCRYHETFSSEESQSVMNHICDELNNARFKDVFDILNIILLLPHKIRMLNPDIYMHAIKIIDSDAYCNVALYILYDIILEFLENSIDDHTLSVIFRELESKFDRLDYISRNASFPTYKFAEMFTLALEC